MEKSTLSSTYRKHIGTTQTSVSATLMAENGVSIGKILCVNTKACVENVEVLSGEARFSGTLTFEALFTSENGEFFTSTQSLPFTEKLEDSSLSPSMQPIYKVEVVESNITRASNADIEITATIEVPLDCILTDEVEEVCDCGESVMLNSSGVKCVRLVSTGNRQFSAEEEYDVKANIEKVLFYDAQALIKSAVSQDKYFTVEGEIYVNAIVSVVEDEQRMLKNVAETISFKEDIPDENLSVDDLVFAYASINPANVNVTVENANTESSATSLIKVNSTVDVRYVAFVEEEKQVCTDSYSLTHKTNTISDSFNVCSLLKSTTNLERIDGSITLDDEQPRIAKIVSSYGARATVLNSYALKDTINVEGIGYATVIYLTDEDEKLNSAVVEVPFSVKLGCDGLTEKDMSFSRVLVKDLDAKTKKGKEINLELELEFVTDVYSTNTEVTIKEIELTEEIMPSEYALQIYIAPKGSTLWDIAKHLNIRQEAIESQNPTLTYPLEQSESIVYFRSGI